VGIPARVVTSQDHDRREAQAAKLGFAAYAISSDMNDPVVQALHKLLDHAAATDARFEQLVSHLQRDGVDCGDAKATAERFDPAQINKMLE
jgi:serine O-acetyltransferase